MDWRIFVSVDEEFSGVTAAFLEQAARAALAVAPEFAGPEPAGPVQLSLLLTDDAAVRALNAQYRGLDETTDVLSFSSEHPGQWEGDDDDAAPPPEGVPESIPGLPDSVPDSVFDGFILPPGEPHPLGEVIISYPQAARQADAAGRSIAGELRLLVVHGTLHLLGYDHAEPEETKLMQSLERAALRRRPPAESEGGGAADGRLSGYGAPAAAAAIPAASSISADADTTADSTMGAEAE